MSTAVFYIRTNGKIRGPFGLEQISQFVARGVVRLPADVSTDRRNWCPLQSLPAFAGQMPADGPAAYPGARTYVPPLPVREQPGPGWVATPVAPTRAEPVPPQLRDALPLPLTAEEPDYEITLDLPDAGTVSGRGTQMGDGPADDGAGWFGDLDFGSMVDE